MELVQKSRPKKENNSPTLPSWRMPSKADLDEEVSDEGWNSAGEASTGRAQRHSL